MNQIKESGFSLIETIIALVILMVGILATLSAISFSIFYVQESEKVTFAKEYARSTMETIFSIRDLQLFDSNIADGTYKWDRIVMKSDNNSGIFLSGWNPIRENPGADGIYGTSDDACSGAGACVVGGTTNNSAVVPDYQRKIEITDINENGIVRKRYIVVRVRYWVGIKEREITESTIIANLPVE